MVGPKLKSVVDAGPTEAKLMFGDPVENERVLSIVPTICPAHAAGTIAIIARLRRINCLMQMLLAIPETEPLLSICENAAEKHSQ